MEVYFATGNPIKLAEARALLPYAVHGTDLMLQEVQSLDVQEVVRHKMSQVAELSQEVPVLVEDTGLGIEHWGGYPGALIRWAIGGLGLQRFAEDARRGRPVATATATSCVGVAYRGETAVWSGRTTGTIVAPRGSLGGWTPVFQVDGHAETLAEMHEQVRLAVTMRAEPLRCARQWLDARASAAAGSVESRA